MVKSNQPSSPAKPAFQVYPLDRVAIALMVVLMVLISGLLLSGDSTAPRVRDFSWQNRQVGAKDTAFILTFNRPMDQDSVAQNLRIDPPLLGRTSWAGRRMAYTLNYPAPYGTSYTVSLRGARDRFTDDQRIQNQPFTGNFQTRDRAFVYLGVEKQEEGRLVLYNLSRQQKTILSPPNLVVMDFKPYPKGDRILFSATDPASLRQGLMNQKLYTVTTGINPAAPNEPEPAIDPPGQVLEVLGSDDYQNLKFDLSPDGQTIVLKRVSRTNPGADFGIWVIREGQPPQRLQTEPGGDFLITPDGTSLAMTQGQGLAILPLCQQNPCPPADPLEFLPKFGMILGFSANGQSAAMIKFNTDYTRSLFLVNSQGQERELLRFQGTVLKAQFDPTGKLLYCLLTQLLPGQVYQEQPLLAVINLATGKGAQLNSVPLPLQQDIQADLAPDGLAILYDQAEPTTEPQQSAAPRTPQGRSIATSKLFLLPLNPSTDPNKVPTPVDTVELPMRGFRPMWLP